MYQVWFYIAKQCDTPARRESVENPQTLGQGEGTHLCVCLCLPTYSTNRSSHPHSIRPRGHEDPAGRFSMHRSHAPSMHPIGALKEPCRHPSPSHYRTGVPPPGGVFVSARPAVAARSGRVRTQPAAGQQQALGDAPDREGSVRSRAQVSVAGHRSICRS